MIITFFGHSKFTSTKEHEEKILAFLEEKVGDNPAYFYLGDYGLFDTFAYNCCKKYKANHPNVSLIFITPYITVEYQQNHLEHQKKRYDNIIYPEIEGKPMRFAITYRNRWMIEQSDYVIFGVNHNWGGAFQAYQHAKRKKKYIFNVFDSDI